MPALFLASLLLVASAILLPLLFKSFGWRLRE
jgi:hypothetical protein